MEEEHPPTARRGGIETRGDRDEGGALKGKLEEGGIHEPPTTIAAVLTNALYAMEFHKHLAITNRSENYEFFQSVSHFAHDGSTGKQAVLEAASKINNLYVVEMAPLRVALGDDIRRDVKEAIDSETVNKQTFDAAQKHVLSLMEKESLPGFLESDLYSGLRQRMADGKMEALLLLLIQGEEDMDNARNIMSKEFIEFLGDYGPKEVLSSREGIDWFRQYLVIEFAEEGLDLWEATRDMLVEQQRSRSRGLEGEGKDAAAAEASREASAEMFDIRTAGRELFARFIASGCGSECNLPGTVVKKVKNALDNEGASAETIAQAFEHVELEIFKLLAYDPFLRFKRSGLYTKYCMNARLKEKEKAKARE